MPNKCMKITFMILPVSMNRGVDTLITLQQGVAFNESEYNQPTAVPPSKASRRQAPQAAVSTKKMHFEYGMLFTIPLTYHHIFPLFYILLFYVECSTIG